MKKGTDYIGFGMKMDNYGLKVIILTVSQMVFIKPGMKMVICGKKHTTEMAQNK